MLLHRGARYRGQSRAHGQRRTCGIRSTQGGSFRRARHGATDRRDGSCARTRALHDVTRHERRGDPDQCRGARALRAGLRAVLAEGRGAGRARGDPSQRLHRRQTTQTVLLQQCHRQPARNHDCAYYLIFDGVLERYPKLKILTVHGGGYLPAYHGRIDHAWGARSDAHGELPQPPTSYLKKIYFDSVVFTPHQLAELVRLYGPDRILMGTDYPFDMAEYDPVAHVASVDGLDAATVAAIAGGNARKLLRI